jgi:hypothetical protein
MERFGFTSYTQYFLNTLEANMTIQQEYAEDLIDTDPVEVLAHMDMEQLAGTIRALYWANQKGDMLSLNLFAKSISNAFFEEAMGITEKKLNEANVYQGPYDAMYDAGHQHGDFF